MTPYLFTDSLVGSRESTVQAPESRGNCLEEICEILNNIKDPQFCVLPKDLRDHLKSPGRERLRGALEFPWNIEKKDKIMEDYLGRRDEVEAKQNKESAEDRNKECQDKATGEEMRERARERPAQTKQRKYIQT